MQILLLYLYFSNNHYIHYFNLFLGNLQDALNIAKEILKLQPGEKSIIKAKTEIEEKLQKENIEDEKGDNTNHGNTNKNEGKQKMVSLTFEIYGY